MTREVIDAIGAQAQALGFDDCGVAALHLDPVHAVQLSRWLDQGRHGDMAWMETHRERRSAPQALWPEARSAVILAQSYAPEGDPLELLSHPDRGNISVYARGRDYHDSMKGRMKTLAGWIASRYQAQVKVFVDTAPVMEKPLASGSGIGWRGHHTNLVSRRLGSWFFLGEILTTLDLEPDAPHANLCGTCRACVSACPTGALDDLGMDARRCISYLTIEHKGHIPQDLRAPMGNRIYGCDDCLAVCPWNKFRRPAHPALASRAPAQGWRLDALAALDDAGFRAQFSGSPVKRVGRDRFVRNVLIAIGNSGDVGMASTVLALADDASPLVRAMVAWALMRLAVLPGAPAADIAQMRTLRLIAETDEGVRTEWLGVSG